MGQYDLALGDDLMLGDDVGDDFGDDVGDDFGDDFGDDVSGRRRRRARPQQQQEQRKIRLQRIQPTKQTQTLNFPQGPNGAANFGAGVSGTLEARPQRVFQTERFVVPSTLAPFFAITDLVIGRDSMFVNSEAAAAEIFSQTGVNVTLRGFIARPGIDVTLNVVNIDAGAHPFYASIIGPTLT